MLYENWDINTSTVHVVVCFREVTVKSLVGMNNRRQNTRSFQVLLLVDLGALTKFPFPNLSHGPYILINTTNKL